MQCPACGNSASVKDFGSPAVCPSCSAIYEKALVARAKKNELAGIREQASALEDAPREPSKLIAWIRRVRLPNLPLPSKPLHITLLVMLGFFIFSLLTKDDRPPRPAGPLTAEEEAWRYEQMGKQKVSGRLKDAESARWGEIFKGKKGPVCGSVNAKNSFGAYTGFRRFVAGAGEFVVLENDMTPAEFEKLWSSMCR